MNFQLNIQLIVKSHLHANVLFDKIINKSNEYNLEIIKYNKELLRVELKFKDKFYRRVPTFICIIHDDILGSKIVIKYEPMEKNIIIGVYILFSLELIFDLDKSNFAATISFLILFYVFIDKVSQWHFEIIESKLKKIV